MDCIVTHVEHSWWDSDVGPGNELVHRERALIEDLQVDRVHTGRQQAVHKGIIRKERIHTNIHTTHALPEGVAEASHIFLVILQT
jgi:hypothetical protein